MGEYICWSTMFYYIETVFLHVAKEEKYKENIEGLRLKNDGSVNAKHKTKGVVNYFRKTYTDHSYVMFLSYCNL